MNPIEHPGTIMLIHKEMVHREMSRNVPVGHRESRGPEPRNGPISGVRSLTSRMLISVGTWIAPPQGTNEPAPEGANMSLNATVERG